MQFWDFVTFGSVASKIKMKIVACWNFKTEQIDLRNQIKIIKMNQTGPRMVRVWMKISENQNLKFHTDNNQNQTKPTRAQA